METYVCDVDVLKEQGKMRVHVEGVAILMAYVNDQVYAINDLCPHMKASLYKGTLDETGIVTCKAHQAQIDIKDGSIKEKARLLFLKMPTKRATTYPTVVYGKKVYVKTS